MAFLSKEDIRKIGFKHVGDNVQLSEHANFYNPSQIIIMSNVRIDDFVILSSGSQGIEIGNYVHIACYSSIIGEGKVIMKDFSGLSSRVTVYSSSANYDGRYMTNPTLPDHVLDIDQKPVTIGRHAVIGASSIVLPGVNIGDGSAIGALSLVNKNIDSSSIAIGIPAKTIKKRNTDLFELESKL